MIIQKGAFNPLHRMHIRIAEDAKKHFPNMMHVMTICRHSCDKGETPQDELNTRAEALKNAGYRVIIEDSGLFIDTIERVREALHPDETIVFPCGEDTIQRFFRDWEAFYDWKTNPDHWKKYSEYKRIFHNVIWYVSRRDTECRKLNHLVLAYMREYNNIEWSDLELDDISSTKIRNKEV